MEVDAGHDTWRHKTLSHKMITNIPKQKQGPSVGVDTWQSAQMLSDLLQIQQGTVLSLHYGAHSSQGSALELFAPIQTVAKLEESVVVFSNTGVG